MSITLARPHLGEPADCPTSVRQSPDESLAAPVRTGQGEGTLPTAADPIYGRAASFLMDELARPFGFWTLCCDSDYSGRLIPAAAVREARRA